jgi:hypothetical protein
VSVAFSAASVGIGETAGNVTLTAQLSASSDKTVTVHYATSDSSAAAGQDYTSTSGTLTFSPGTLSQSLTVPITDEVGDGNLADELFNATLSNPTNAIIGSPAGEGVTISQAVSSSWSAVAAPQTADPQQSVYTPFGPMLVNPQTGALQVPVALDVHQCPHS